MICYRPNSSFWGPLSLWNCKNDPRSGALNTRVENCALIAFLIGNGSLQDRPIVRARFSAIPRNPRKSRNSAFLAEFVTLNLGWGSLKVTGIDTDRSATYDIPLTFHSNHDLTSNRFRDKRRFQSKIEKKIHTSAFAPPLSLELDIGARGQKLEWWSRKL